MSKGIIYYTTNKLDGTKLNDMVLDTVRAANLPITSCSQKPMDFGNNIIYLIDGRKGRSHTRLYSQILTALKVAEQDYVFFCEHDVLYHPSHFDFEPERDDTYYYNRNAYKYRLADRKIITYDTGWLSQLCVNREFAIKHYEKRLQMIKDGQKAFGYEPGTGQSKNIDNGRVEYFESEYPNIDVRHGDNWTGTSRMDPSEFKDKDNCKNFREIDIREVPGWEFNVLMSL